MTHLNDPRRQLFKVFISCKLIYSRNLRVNFCMNLGNYIQCANIEILFSACNMLYCIHVYYEHEFNNMQ